MTREVVEEKCTLKLKNYTSKYPVKSTATSVTNMYLCLLNVGIHDKY